MRGGGIIPSLSLHTLESFLAKQSLEKFANILSLALTEKLQRNNKAPLILVLNVKKGCQISSMLCRCTGM